MTDLAAYIAAMPEDQRAVAIGVLDAVSRPMTVREIERALRANGVTRSRAIKLAGTLKHFHIIAVAGPEVANG